MKVGTMFNAAVLTDCKILEGLTESVVFLETLDKAPKVTIVGVMNNPILNGNRGKHVVIICQSAEKKIRHHVLHGKALYFLLLASVYALITVTTRHLYYRVCAVFKVVDPLSGVSTIVRVFNRYGRDAHAIVFC